MKTCFIFAGEASGDLHGSQLIQHIHCLNSNLQFMGVGGPCMRSQGLHTLLDMEEFQVMGFTDVMRSLPKLFRHFKKVKNHILETNPDLCILIDYPGFNLRLAKALRKGGYQGKIVQYIAPSVWAHGQSRIDTLSSTVDLLLTIYPFEAAYFSHTKLNVRYVGNPLVTHAHQAQSRNWKNKLAIPESGNLIAIFPGSREGEIKRNLPPQLEACKQLAKERPDCIFAISVSQPIYLEPIQNLLTQHQLRNSYLVPGEYTQDLIHHSHTAIAKSGTVTLELALNNVPTVVSYSLTRLNYLIAKYVLKLKLPYYCIVNILGNKEIFPEIIDHDLCSQQLFLKLKTILQETKRQEIKNHCAAIQNLLGHDNAHQNAAKAILELIA